MYLFEVIKNNQPVFILVLAFELKHLAGQAGFKWNNAQPGAWATTDVSVALAAIKNNFNTIVVELDTLKRFNDAGKFLPATYDILADRAIQFQPERKTKAAIEAATMSDEKIAAIHQALQNLAAVCDGSLREDEKGFNRNDVEYGHTLANKSQLTRSDAGYGSLLLYKYRGQIGEELYSVIFPEVFERERLAEEEKAAKKAAKEAARADKAAQKAAPKLHKAGQVCDWLNCELDACKVAHQQPLEELVYVDEIDDHILSVAPTASKIAARELAYITSPHYVTDHVEQTDPMPAVCSGKHIMKDGYCNECFTYHSTPEIKKIEANPNSDVAEITRLATSLIDCYPQDFDTTVELLRALRKIDEPKKAGSEFLQAAWQSAGYQTK